MSVRLALSVRAAWRRTAHFRYVEINTFIFLIKINLYFGHRHAVGKLHYTVWFYKVRWSFPSHFPMLLNTLLMPVRILLLISFQVDCLSITYNDTFSARIAVLCDGTGSPSAARAL